MAISSLATEMSNWVCMNEWELGVCNVSRMQSIVLTISKVNTLLISGVAKICHQVGSWLM